MSSVSPENNPETSRDAAASYWTPERMRDAKPMEKTVTERHRLAVKTFRLDRARVRAFEKAPARKPARKNISRSAGLAGGVTTGPATSVPGYWN